MARPGRSSETGWKKEHTLADKEVFAGTWSLDPDRNLRLRLNKKRTAKGAGDLRFKSEIIDVRSNAITFLVTSRKKGRRESLRLLKLRGQWQADRSNRLTFLIKKTRGQKGTLTLQGAWDTGKNNHLTYRATTTNLKTKRKKERLITFKGYWDIAEKNRLTYALDLKNNSGFTFKVKTGSPSLRGKKGLIKFRLGIGAKGRRGGGVHLITLTGAWKFARKGGLAFEIDYGNGRRKAIRFQAQARINRQNKLTLALKSKIGQSLGMTLTLNHKLHKQAETLLRLRRTHRESKIETNFKMLW